MVIGNSSRNARIYIKTLRCIVGNNVVGYLTRRRARVTVEHNTFFVICHGIVDYFQIDMSIINIISNRTRTPNISSLSGYEVVGYSHISGASSCVLINKNTIVHICAGDCVTYDIDNGTDP